MNKFAIVMITVDRSPGKNYLIETLENLKRGGVFDSPLLGDFTIFDSGSEIKERHVNQALDTVGLSSKINRVIAGIRRTPTENSAIALSVGARLGFHWVLFLEDDIDVCADFLESTAVWLEEHAEKYRVFPLAAKYDEILAVLARRGDTMWRYPVECFYGTVAITMRSEDALSIATYLEGRKNEHQYDLHMQDWARERDIKYFLTPVPSFVQHIGAQSFIRPGSDPIAYGSWPGREWSYARKVAQ